MCLRGTFNVTSPGFISRPFSRELQARYTKTRIVEIFMNYLKKVSLVQSSEILEGKNVGNFL